MRWRCRERKLSRARPDLTDHRGKCFKQRCVDEGEADFHAMCHSRPVGVAQKLVTHVLRRLEHRNARDIAARIRHKTGRQTPERPQATQAFAREAGIHDLRELVRQKQAAAQQVGTSPARGMVEQAERLWISMGKARGEC